MLGTREVPKERMDKLDNIAELLNVFPLKMLATRKVLEERMDYKDYLGGRVKEEVDRLDRLTGKFIVLESRH